MKIFLRWLTLIVCGWQVMAASQAAAAISLTTFTADESTNGLLVMKGVVEGISENTRAWCEYGWSPYTNIQRTVATNLSQDGNVIFPITDNFVGGRNYYARLMASNSTGVVRGPATPFGWPALSLVGDAVVTNGDFGMYLNGGALATMAPLAIAEGNRYGMILKSDRTCVTWVPPALTISAPSYSFPPGLSNVVAVGGGINFGVVVKSDGTAAHPPIAFITPPVAATNLIAASCASTYAVGLRSDHTVICWGSTATNILNVPGTVTNVIKVAAGTDFVQALQSDGTLAVWGSDPYGNLNVPAGLSNVLSMAAGDYHSLAIKPNGTVVAWGADYGGETLVPAGLSNVVEVAAGIVSSLALKSDGSVVAWGEMHGGPVSVPAELTNVVALAANEYNNIALQADGTIHVWGSNSTNTTLTNLPPCNAFPSYATGTLNTNVPGTYFLTYQTPTNYFGGQAVPVTRKVVITVAPAIQNLYPTHGPTLGGTLLTLTGTNLGTQGTVTIGGLPAAILTNGWTTNQIQCWVPAGQGTNLPIIVTANNWPITPGAFSYDPPAVQSFFPSHAPTLTGATITIQGTNFGLTGTLVMGSTLITNFLGWSDEIISFVIPPGLGGNYVITLTVGGQKVVAGNFSYDAPAIANVAPNHGPTQGNIPVTVTGSDFGPPGSGFVIVGDPTQPQPIVFWSPTNIMFSLLPGQGTNRPLVINVAGQTNAFYGFNYDSPVIFGLAPTNLPTAGGVVCLLTGTNFGTVGTVTVGGNPATNYPTWSQTGISFQLPAGEGLGQAVVVIVSNQPSPPWLVNYGPPGINNMNPTTGNTAGGTIITLTGTNFGLHPLVTVGGNFAQIVTNTHSLIQFKLPPGQGTNIQVSVLVAGQPSSSVRFDYDPPAISYFSPATGPTAGGPVIALKGINLGSSGTVWFGDNVVTNFLDWNSTNIAFALPPGQGTVAVSVDVAGRKTPAASFTYAAPDLQNISPGSGPTMGGTVITLYGTNFGLTPRVAIGGNPATIQTNTHGFIQCLLPPGQGLNQPVMVAVGGQTNTQNIFNYDPPLIFGRSATNGPTQGGTSLTLTGTNLGSSGQIMFGTFSVTSIQSWNSTQIVFTLPPGEGRDLLWQFQAGNQGAPPGFFSYDPPEIQTITPPTGPTLGGVTLSVTGKNFGLGPTVLFDGQFVQPTTNSHTQIQFTLPRGQGTNRMITVMAGTQTSNTKAFDYAAPFILSVTPSNGPSAGGTLITISGLNLGSSGTLLIGGHFVTPQGVSASWDDSTIKCTTPPASPGPATVSLNVGGQFANAALFNYADPVLAITNNLGQLTLFWPTNAPTYGLEKTLSLKNINWVSFGSPLRTTNGNFATDLLPNETNAFFRLRSP